MKLDFFYSFNKFFVVFCPSEQIYDLFQIIFRIGTSAESLPHKEYGFQLALAQQQILPPCAGLLDVNRRKYPLFRQMPVKYKLHIAGPLEFLEHDVIHPAPRIDQRCGKNRQASALSHISGRAKEPFWHVERCRVQAARKSTSARGNREIVCSGKSCDAVEENDYIISPFNQPLRPLNDHLRYPLMVFR